VPLVVKIVAELLCRGKWLARWRVLGGKVGLGGLAPMLSID